MRRVSRLAALGLMEASNGRLFSVTFRKRSDGTVRQMVARTGVRSWLTGGSLAFDPEEKQLIVVAELRERAYKMVPWGPGELLSIRMNGEEMEVAD